MCARRGNSAPCGKTSRVPRTTAGTTGQPTLVGYTRADLDTWANLVARSLRAAGARGGDIVHIAAEGDG